MHHLRLNSLDSMPLPALQELARRPTALLKGVPPGHRSATFTVQLPHKSSAENLS